HAMPSLDGDIFVDLEVFRDIDLLGPKLAPGHVLVPRREIQHVVGGTGLAILLRDGVLNVLRKNRHYVTPSSTTPRRRASWKVSTMMDISTFGYSSCKRAMALSHASVINRTSARACAVLTTDN